MFAAAASHSSLAIGPCHEPPPLLNLAGPVTSFHQKNARKGKTSNPARLILRRSSVSAFVLGNATWEPSYHAGRSPSHMGRPYGRKTKVFWSTAPANLANTPEPTFLHVRKLSWTSQPIDDRNPAHCHVKQSHHPVEPHHPHTQDREE